MKYKIYLVCFLTLMATSFMSYSQVYKTVADTVKLNKELTEVSNDIASLSAKLTIAQNNLPGYQSKARSADADAQQAAEKSSDQAIKSTDGGVKEARQAKRKSKKAYREAKDARSANNVVENQDERIASLTKQLAKKEQRLSELIVMREAINSLPAQQ